eukprot:CAMPEP_0117471454 /NCGR_PEP_ID=MMETSP0784-20121206/7738_1 /TAXON_ID=39447 /ORGANISM="" /LENGTH=296 /DNA_ID=CAMNT_0005265571 /DNA_START=72 /DNA_END=962 /DNA_ORIENTATION=-
MPASAHLQRARADPYSRGHLQRGSAAAPAGNWPATSSAAAVLGLAHKAAVSQQVRDTSSTGRCGSGTTVVVSDEDHTMLNCASLNAWHSPEADRHQGLLFARSLEPLTWQFVADRLLRERSDILDDVIHQQDINLLIPETLLKRKFQEAAFAVSRGLPPELAELVFQDATAMANASHKLVPGARQLTMKLELFGKNVCARWHQDHYVCRSIVSYNGYATEYSADSNIDFQELLYCGNNDHIIRDKSRICSISVGDIMMIKGTLFPGTAKGLVHKSPDVRYHDNGDVQPRLVLKVDI